MATRVLMVQPGNPTKPTAALYLSGELQVGFCLEGRK
jgi:hypothetical protein